MRKTCANGWCGKTFEVTDEDLAFYESISPTFAGQKQSIPAPRRCPDCRAQGRYLFRNERKLYRRQCAKTGKNVISIYHPQNPHTIYSTEAWWADDWDPLSYGKDIDWERPFFEQFAELYRAVPHLALVNVNNENCDYANQCGWSKNCYMTFITDYSEDCYYTYCCFDCRSCVDCTGLHDCELCYDSVDCGRSYACVSCRNCSTCTDCELCADCKGCKNCFGCSGLRNKEYWIFNENVGEEKYRAFMASIDRSPTSMKGHVTKADAIRLRLPHPHAVMINCIDCTGNDLIDSKNAVACYDGKNAEDCKYCVQVASATKNAQDMAGSGGGELMYQGISSGPGYNTRFTIHCWNDNADITYSVFCMNGSRDLFGCVGLRKGQYCILNKQYTKEEYETLVPRLIEHMRKTGEWGEFFPASMSPFAYNETVAEDHYPLSQAEAKSRGFPWSVIPEDAPVVERFIPAGSLPVDIAAVPDDILNWAIECAATKRPYRIIKQELEFYRKTHTPIPRLHPDERYRQRMALRNPRHLWDRQCAKCAKAIQTTYAPERPEIVYCEECYLKEVY